MKSPPTCVAPPAFPAGGAFRPAPWLVATVIVLAALGAYVNSLSTPFIFDDGQSITDNASIRDLTALAAVLSPPGDGSGVTGRPLVNLSLALNYAMTGLRVESYHATNLAIHALAGLALFGIVRRTLLGPVLRGKFAADATLVAGLSALLWTVHPLQTESVTCVIQRTESLMGLCYLLTVYSFVRAIEAPELRRWRVLTVVSALAGMATKEVMVSVPLMLLLHDRTFFAGDFRAAWARRRSLYLQVSATWGVLFLLVLRAAASRSGGESAMSVPTIWSYALTQCEALPRYLGLCVWPHPLVLDYGLGLVEQASDVFGRGALVLVALGATGVALWRWPVGGFLAAWGFIILAPSSSIVPLLSQPIAEHRMYLPLAAFAVAVVAGVHRVCGRRGLAAGGVLALACLVGTVQRNTDFRTEESIWRDTLAKRPTSARAHFNLGVVQAAAGRPVEAIGSFKMALRLNPTATGRINAYFSLGCAQEAAGRTAEALASFEIVVRLQPAHAEARNNLGRLLDQQGRNGEALTQLELAVRQAPAMAAARANLGIALLHAGRAAEAMTSLEEALRLRPSDFQAHGWMASALAGQGRLAEASRHYAAALRLKPDYAEAHNNLGVICLAQGQRDEGIAHLENAVRLDPAYVDAWKNLSRALANQGQLEPARAQLREALRRRPDDAELRARLAELEAAAQPGVPR